MSAIEVKRGVEYKACLLYGSSTAKDLLHENLNDAEKITLRKEREVKIFRKKY